MPESGAELYSISVDINSPPFEGNYVVFLANSEAHTGTLRASKNMTNGKNLKRSSSKKNEDRR
jgi:hypothetical protein